MPIHSCRQRTGEAIRVATADDLTVYMNPNIAEIDRETITPVSPTEALEEAWFLGLRLNDGVSLPEIAREFGNPPRSQPISQFSTKRRQQGLIEYDERRARLTQQGRLFANDVFQRFLGVVHSDETASILIPEQGVFA